MCRCKFAVHVSATTTETHMQTADSVFDPNFFQKMPGKFRVLPPNGSGSLVFQML
jgi:hypothetical protein